MVQRLSFPRLFAVLLLWLGVSAPAQAGVPNPTTSTVPSCLTICPNGDRPFSIVVRDAISAPVVGASVVLDLSSCPSAVIALCDRCAQTTEYNPATKRFRKVTDASGVANFALCGTILCTGGVEVSADGVILAYSYPAFATTDLDGDLDVDANDLAIVTAQMGNPYRPADEDCSGVVDAVDGVIVTEHLGHMCPVPVSATSRTWGVVKAIYR